MPEAGIEPARLAAADFESAASTNSTTRAELRVAEIMAQGWDGAWGRCLALLDLARLTELVFGGVGAGSDSWVSIHMGSWQGLPGLNRPSAGLGFISASST